MTGNNSLCDNCHGEMNSDTGCHSLWVGRNKDKIITLCNICYMELEDG